MSPGKHGYRTLDRRQKITSLGSHHVEHHRFRALHVVIHVWKKVDKQINGLQMPRLGCSTRREEGEGKESNRWWHHRVAFGIELTHDALEFLGCLVWPTEFTVRSQWYLPLGHLELLQEQPSQASLHFLFERYNIYYHHSEIRN